MQPVPGRVTIIIPTCRRVPLLREAVSSALAQTYPDTEFIVVSDGPDPEARAAIESLTESHSHLIYTELPANAGPAEARNAGARLATGEWLSFLDDDDTMLPEKTSRQMSLANPENPQRMIACRAIYRHGPQPNDHKSIWPARVLMPADDLATYLLQRPSLLGRPGIIPLQALLVHHTILAQVPFTSHPDHEDWAWLLEAWYLAGARLAFVWEPLVVYNIVTDAISRSRRTNWRDSLAWAQRYRHWIPNRAYTSFLATKVALKARRAADWPGLRSIISEVLHNRPSLLDLAFLLGITLLPTPLLHRAWKRSLTNISAKS
jgi:glycosyltransferase involved in cell wall biosynthesis